MNRPRIVGPLKPTTGPVISPIEVHGSELIVPTGATLPPVCLVSGQTMEMSDVHYLPDFLPLEMEAIGETGYKKVYVANAQSMVRLPFSKEGIQSKSLHQTIRRNKWHFLIATLCVFLPVAVYFHYKHPSSEDGVRTLILGFNAWFMLIFGVAIYRRKGSGALTARALSDGKIAISGIDISILQSMLDWQQQNSKIQNS